MTTPPWQAVVAAIWAVIGPPLLIYAATRPRAGRLRAHRVLMIAAVVIELGVFTSFGFLGDPHPRRDALMALPIFKVHLAFAITALAGLGWQVASRLAPRLVAYHRHTGPYVVLIWCLALLTGMYNYVFLYVLAP
jgi:hypothetical protein